MEACYKNISKIRNVTFIFQNFQRYFQKRKKIEKIQMDFEKSINPFGIKNRISHLIIYGTIILLSNLFITFRHYYFAKYVFDFFKYN